MPMIVLLILMIRMIRLDSSREYALTLKEY
jgi:hypothetical protein